MTDDELLAGFKKRASSTGWKYQSEVITEDEDGNPCEPWLAESISKAEPFAHHPDLAFSYRLSVPDVVIPKGPQGWARFVDFADHCFAAKMQDAQIESVNTS